jgi:hypothetical protein
LAKLKEQVGTGGASSRAAEYLFDVLDARRRPELKTHYPFAVEFEHPARGAA